MSLAAVYDVLMQWDSSTGEFSPKLADSLEANENSTVWTLKLRDNVKFSDGTPLDAAAVVASINRYNAGRGNGAQLWVKSVQSTVASSDGKSVVFTLNAPWAQFPSMLALGHGSIVNMASIHAFQIIAGCFPYPVAKHGVIGLTRALAIEYAAQNIRVNAICPGYVETQILSLIHI